VSGISRTSAVADGIGMPTKTTARALEDLAVLGLLDRSKSGATDNAANEWSLGGTETSEGS
jgi:DNA-binding IclR family transcriptional regulator